MAVITFTLSTDYSYGSGTFILVSSDFYGNISNGESYASSISNDGRYIAFQSSATNLVPDVNAAQSNIFLKDANTGTTTLVSGDSAGNQSEAGSYSTDAHISGDGRYVAFTSSATNLVYGGTSGTQAFLKDTQSGATTLISSDSAGSQANNNYSAILAISRDGRFVAFRSSATNLSANASSGLYQVFMKDTVSGTTSLVSSDSAGNPGNSDSDTASVSEYGRYVTFTSAASNLAGNANGIYTVFLKDTVSGTTSPVVTDLGGAGIESGGPNISPDGRYVVFSSSSGNIVPGDTNGRTDAFVKDLQTGTITRADTDSAGNQATFYSGCFYCSAVAMGISDNGRYALFMADAKSNLVLGGLASPGSFWVAFVKDLQTGNLKQVSINPSGITAQGEYPSMSGDGAYVSFQSYDSNYVLGDTNSAVDIFRAAIGSFSLPAINYYFPWYDGKFGLTWLLMASQPGSPSNSFDSYLKNGSLEKGIAVAPGSTNYRRYSGQIGGPVKLTSGNGPALVSERSLFGDSFEEVWSTPYGDLDSHYYWPIYCSNAASCPWLPPSVSIQEWVLVANPVENAEPIQVDLKFLVGATPYSFTQTIQPGDSWTPSWALTAAHNVEVQAYRVGGSASDPSDARKAIASERILMNGAFNEMPGIPVSQLGTDYTWTWYDSVNGTDAIVVANPNALTVYVSIYLHGNMILPPQQLDPDSVAYWTSGDTDLMDGPIEVRACGNTSLPCTSGVGNIYASQISVMGPAYEEIAGTRDSLFTPSASWTWYDMQSPGSLNWILIANPYDTEIYYEISMPGVDPASTPGASGMLQPHDHVTPWFPGIKAGPVRVMAWMDPSKSATANIMASQRVLWKGYFNEVVGQGS